VPTHTATSEPASDTDIIADAVADHAETLSSTTEEVAAAESDDNADEPDLDAAPSAKSDAKNRTSWSQTIAFVLLPLVVVTLSGVAGWLKWIDVSSRDARVAATESVQAARDTTVAILSYQPDTVQQTLESAQARLTGTFRDSYGKLIHDVVIPGAREKKISAIANVPAASSISATENHAEVLVFVNQTSIIGAGAPTDTASSVRVGLDKADGHWLISSFEPI
jgi:Mce-associated membrane protein